MLTAVEDAPGIAVSGIRPDFAATVIWDDPVVPLLVFFNRPSVNGLPGRRESTKGVPGSGRRS